MCVLLEGDGEQALRVLLVTVVCVRLMKKMEMTKWVSLELTTWILPTRSETETRLLSLRGTLNDTTILDLHFPV